MFYYKIGNDYINFYFDSGEKVALSAIKDERSFTKYLGTLSIEEQEEDHAGQVYNPITGEWKWL